MDKKELAKAAANALKKKRQEEEERICEIERNVAMAHFRAGYAMGSIARIHQQVSEGTLPGRAEAQSLLMS